MNKTHILIIFSGFGELGHLMIYWLTTIKSQIAKKHSNKTRKKYICCCKKENGKKISVSNHNENNKKIIDGYFF